MLMQVPIKDMFSPTIKEKGRAFFVHPRKTKLVTNNGKIFTDRSYVYIFPKTPPPQTPRLNILTYIPGGARELGS